MPLDEYGRDVSLCFTAYLNRLIWPITCPKRLRISKSTKPDHDLVFCRCRICGFVTIGVKEHV